MIRTVTLFGNPLTLVGREVHVGDYAPSFVVIDKDLREIRFNDFNGKIKLISTTPSLDTPVCDLQLRTFNKRASGLSDEVVILNISMDLPFAIARFCSSAGIERVQVLSDHREASFGLNYGLLIKELRLLGRAVIVIDRHERIRYLEIVSEISEQPDYNKVLSFIEKLLSGKSMKALIITSDNFEDSEVLYPLYRLTEEGYLVDIASFQKAKIKGKHGYQIEPNLTFEEIRPEEYDLLIIPGGKAPETLRKDMRVLEVVRSFFQQGKLIGAICHGPQVLISAGVLSQKRATAHKEVVKELLESGALYEDKNVVIEDNLITSRSRSDLPYFMREILKVLYIRGV